MELRRKLLIMVWILGGFPAAATAQITITGTDVGTHLQLGNTITNIGDTLLTSLNIGAPGLTSLDFSGLQAHTTTQLTSVTVASTPFAGSVPGATHALKTVISGPYAGIPVPVNANVYLYYTLGARLERPGTLAGGVIHLAPGVDLPAELRNTNSPMDTMYLLPLTNGTTWTSTYTETMLITLNGSPYQNTTTSHVISYTVDAYGPMKMPGGAIDSALRIRKVESGASPFVAYIFVAKNGASVTVVAADMGQPTSGVISIAPKSVTWNLPAVPLPVQLSYFRVTREGNGSAVALSWATTSETNNFGFEVERRDGMGEFKRLAGSFVPGNGTSIVPHTYAYVDPDVAPGTWYYRLRQMDLDGGVRYSEAQRVDITTGISISDIPLTTSLAQNYPNPFNGISLISYRVATAGRVRITVTDLLGREVARLVDGDQPAGSFVIQWDAGTLSSGVYLLRLEAGQGGSVGPQMMTRRMMLVR